MMTSEKTHKLLKKKILLFKTLFMLIQVFSSAASNGGEVTEQRTRMPDITFNEVLYQKLTGNPESNGLKLDSSSAESGFFLKRGYMGFMSLGLLPGSQEVMYNTPVSLKMSHGYFDPGGFYLGFGLAVENFDPPVLSLFGDLRFIFSKWRVKPWIGTTLGYSIALSSRPNTKDKGGVTAGAGAGMAFTITDRSSVYFYWGYRYQELHSILTNYRNNDIKQLTKFNRMEFRFGLSFR